MTTSVLMPTNSSKTRLKKEVRDDNILLLRSGDVERNPGPTIAKALLMMSLLLTILLAGDVERNPGPANNTCGDCGVKFHKNIKPLVCSECKEGYHKTNCSKESRWMADKIMAENRYWKCKPCREGRCPQPANQARAEEVIPPGKCQASDCRNKIKKGTDFLICSKCSSHFHKQERCSQMTRKQVDNLDRKKWECLGCQLKEANPRPQANDTDEAPDYIIRKTKLSKANIMQFNADSLMSKLEEVKMLLKEEDIAVFLIQETKMIKSDKTPTVPGYTIRRQERSQLVGNEKNRGGGLGHKERHPLQKSRHRDQKRP